MAEPKQYVMITATWPGHRSAVETKHEADKKAPLDALGATVVAHVGLSTLKGFKSIILVDLPEEKFADYVRHVSGRQRMFARAIEGYKFSVDICGDISGA